MAIVVIAEPSSGMLNCHWLLGRRDLSRERRWGRSFPVRYHAYTTGLKFLEPTLTIDRRVIMNKVVLTSPNTKIQVTLELFDDGRLLALLDIKQPDGSYKRQPSEKMLVHAKLQPTMKDVWYLG
jgi:hypothetical protein